ncbi:mercuric ion transport protein [Variovorax sp. HW608]|nr:mercuric transporter MerT family protein [Variovorax sp. HW608]SCK37388.1 mercuric ion transport protein [Variovorax sp. HW608]
MPTIKYKGSLAAGVLAAIGASVCCVGPLVLLTIGVGGAWVASLTALEPLRPWFMAATLVFLGLAFRQLYLQPQVCEPGAACVESAVLKRQRLIFWIVTLALLSLLSVPWLAPFFL